MTVAAKNYPLNCGAINDTFVRTHAKRSLADRSFDLVASEVRRVVSPGSQIAITKDKDGTTSGTPLKSYVRETSAGYETDFDVLAAFRQDGFFLPVAFASDNPSVLAFSSSDSIATFQHPGSCVLRATSIEGETSLTRVVASSEESATVDVFDGWVDGTLANHCVSQINQLVAERTALNVFSVANGSSFVRNADCWANGIDLSCASPWNTTGGSQRAGTLVSPKHLVFCQHANFFPQVGATIFFVSASGVVITRQLQAIQPIGGGPDIVVGLLDSDVDSGVGFAKVLPINYNSYLPSIDFFSTVPSMFLNQDERASIAGIRVLSSIYATTFSSDYADYFGTVVKGDSGNPAFLVIEGEPVLLGVFSSPTNGSHIGHHATAVNAAMTTLGGGYQLTPIDLSAFPTY